MTNERLNGIYDKTHGCCHLCHKKLAFSNYGVHGSKGSWHVEHSIPKAKGGTDHLNNLYPACISCNLNKGVDNTRTIRKASGVTRAPFSKAKKEKIRNQNVIGGGSAGLVVGACFGVPFLGAAIGCFIASKTPHR